MLLYEEIDKNVDDLFRALSPITKALTNNQLFAKTITNIIFRKFNSLNSNQYN